jgi:hypothetical protein
LGFLPSSFGFLKPTCQLTCRTKDILLTRMRILLLICASLVLCGCWGKRHKETNSASMAGTFDEAGKKKLIVTQENSLIGKVALVNPTARFVVLNFPVGRLPLMDQRLNLYRGGLKVGEVKVTGPQYDDNVVADLVAGESEVGDQVRDK